MENQYRLCKRCGLFYELTEFSKTKTGRIRYICNKCEILRKEIAKIEWLRYQSQKRNEQRIKKTNSKSVTISNWISEIENDEKNNFKKINIEISTENPTINLSKIKSLVVNFMD